MNGNSLALASRTRRRLRQTKGAFAKAARGARTPPVWSPRLQGAQRSPPITTARRLARRPSSTPPSGRRHPGLPLSTRSNRVAALFEIISSRETSESGDAKHLAADPRTILGRETPVRVRDPEHGGVPVADSRREYYTSREKTRINAPERVYADSSFFFSREERRVRPQHLRPNRIGGDA